MASKKPAAAHAHERLDRVLHEKARLSIMTALLAQPEGILFPELRTLCNLTDGNLARHLQTLQEAELVELWKNQDGPRPRTLARLSSKGRSSFLAYIGELERIVRAAKAHGSAEARRKGRELPPGWAPA